MIRPVLRYGAPELLRVAAPVRHIDDPAIRELLRDLQDTMADLGGAGLAAPQIGVPLRVVIFGGIDTPRYAEARDVPPTALINPVIEPVGNDRGEGLEGCLSVPGLRGFVGRWHRIRYRGHDPQGRVIERCAEGFHARVVQHECDHLDGILFPMRISDLRRFGFVDSLATSG